MAELPDKEKATHKEVEYVRPSDYPGKDCANCEYVIEAMKGIRCQHVASPIYLSGYCVKWEGKANG